MKSIFLVFVFSFLLCKGFGQNVYSVKKSDYTYSSNRNYYFYIEDPSTNKRLYFFSKSDAKKVLLLLHRQIISFQEFFKLNGLIDSAQILGNLYDQLMNTSAIIITSLDFPNDAKDKPVPAHFEEKIVLRCELKMQFNSAICIPIKHARSIRCVKKRSIAGSPELCEYDI